MPVNNERIDAWIAALRSGKYMQGTSALTSFVFDGIELDCCLGVSCKLAGVEREREADKFFYGSDRYETDSDSGPMKEFNSIALPNEVQAWLGLSSDSGSIFHPYMAGCFSHADIKEWSQITHFSEGSVLSLAVLNDCGFTFNQIADVIDFFREFL